MDLQEKLSDDDRYYKFFCERVVTKHFLEMMIENQLNASHSLIFVHSHSLT